MAAQPGLPSEWGDPLPTNPHHTPTADDVREAWVGERAERYYREQGCDRRLSATLARADWDHGRTEWGTP